MKYFLIASFVLCSFIATYSQDYMSTITNTSCKCLENLPDSLDVQEFNMKLGVCMIEASTPYKKQIRKDYDVDMDNIAVDGTKLGRIIGVKMASVCPNALLKISQRQKGNDTKKNEGSLKGVITRVESDFFVTFSLKDEAGKITKFYWLTFVDSDVDLLNYNSLSFKNVTINYEAREFFDPKIGEYRQFFIIKKITQF